LGYSVATASQYTVTLRVNVAALVQALKLVGKSNQHR
jgi:hypothetical protein